ncbi:hypothetical protein Tco_0065141 [Tanacetum coccineum]
MVGSLMYLTASRPDLVFAVCMCARYQAKPTKKHLEAIKRIFRYLKGTINMGLWYPKDNAMSTNAYADAESCSDVRMEFSVKKSSGRQFLGNRCIHDLSTSTYDTISFESKWKMEWLLRGNKLSTGRYPAKSFTKRAFRISTPTTWDEEFNP